MTTTKKEEVDHPAHYQGKGGMEAIDVKAFDLGFALGNAVKYILRAGRKTASKEGQLEDLQKGTWYLKRAINELARGDELSLPKLSLPIPPDADHAKRVLRIPVPQAVEIVVVGGGGSGGSGKTPTPTKPKPKSKRFVGKRDPDVLAKLRGQLRDFIAKHPDLRVEEINKQLGTKTKDLQLPLRQLIASKTISTKGEKRSTTYWPAKKK